jgi:anaerobic magnesium-protoporphyrin IX monomethyl ester cyclase
MIRIVLINPPSPEKLGAPLLGQQYVAATLLALGCEVRVIDAAAGYFDHDANWILSEIEDFQPDVVGFSLYTRWVWHAYRLVNYLTSRGPLLIAGGPHATVRPVEVLDHGFDIAVVGEAEETLAKLVNWFENRITLSQVPGIYFRDQNGQVQHTVPAHPVMELDRLPFPQNAQHLYDSCLYNPNGNEVIPGGILTSRGCASHCTFCANYVTGRNFRYRSAENVVSELNSYHDKYGVTFFPCWDDALTQDSDRLYRLCAVLERDIHFPFGWSAITRVNWVTPELLHKMKGVGLASVNFGVESGDDEILRAIKKGITTVQVVRALEWAKGEGLYTICNFMLGFPQETPQALERTLRFMERIAPLVDFFNSRGVLVPFPGTPLYDDLHQTFEFTNWWLREEYSQYTPLPPISDPERFSRCYTEDTALDLDFFHYSGEMRSLIRACHRFKAEHNLRKMGLPNFRSLD